ncbi:hypothetical protein PSAC2689_60005 [Paraburkholderia sacchari]
MLAHQTGLSGVGTNLKGRQNGVLGASRLSMRPIRLDFRTVVRMFYCTCELLWLQPIPIMSIAAHNSIKNNVWQGVCVDHHAFERVIAGIRREPGSQRNVTDSLRRALPSCL